MSQQALEVDVNPNASGDQSPGSPGPADHDRSGDSVDEAVAKAETDSQVDEIHTSSEHTGAGESRVDRIREVEGVTESRVGGDPGDRLSPPGPGPSPAETGSGGAQRVVGARISDRVSSGERVPAGPPFDTDTDTDTDDPDPDTENEPQGSRGAGS